VDDEHTEITVEATYTQPGASEPTTAVSAKTKSIGVPFSTDQPTCKDEKCCPSVIDICDGGIDCYDGDDITGSEVFDRRHPDFRQKIQSGGGQELALKHSTKPPQTLIMENESKDSEGSSSASSSHRRPTPQHVRYPFPYVASPPPVVKLLPSVNSINQQHQQHEQHQYGGQTVSSLPSTVAVGLLPQDSVEDYGSATTKQDAPESPLQFDAQSRSLCTQTSPGLFEASPVGAGRSLCTQTSPGLFEASPGSAGPIVIRQIQHCHFTNYYYCSAPPR